MKLKKMWGILFAVVFVSLGIVGEILPNSFWFTQAGKLIIISAVIFLIAYVLRIIIYFLTKPNYTDFFE